TLSCNQVDLILLDVVMSGMDGFEVTQRIRKDPELRLLPIILVTALHKTSDRIRGIEAGCDDFISRPFDKTELAIRVNSLLKVKACNEMMCNHQEDLKFEVTKMTEILHRTFRGVIRMLADILSITNPEAFNTAQRARRLARSICKRLKMDRIWEYELAAILSQIGMSVLPFDIVDKYRRNIIFDEKEQRMFNSHPAIAKHLVSNIPRLECVAEAIGYQMMDFPKTLKIENEHVASIARMLKLSLDFVKAEMRTGDAINMITGIQEQAGIYDPEIFAALKSELESIEKDFIVRQISPQNLLPGMLLAEDMIDDQNRIIASKGTEITEVFQIRLQNALKFGIRMAKIKIRERIKKEDSV
ncbi:MAG: response regulator, partial [Desulfamplus sp.]|nr:response regulator [Desulfamplus sp.]